ncbi:MAG: cyclase family protein [Dactylosporangium sp.]|nr:cyclase family protein [Dactylosporangium sp.]
MRDGPGATDLRAVRLVSLSHVNDPATTSLFPGDPPFTLETVATIASDGYRLQAVCQGEHTGTHWGAPGHFNAGEALADALDPGDLFLPAVKIDIRERCRADPDHAVTLGDLRAWEAEHGTIPDQAAVVLWSGWAERWGTASFAGLDERGVPHHPGFEVDAVRWLVETGRLGYRGALGTEAFSPDRGIDRTYPVSRLLYRRHRISLEVLANLASLPPTGAWILAGGQINRAGTGSPAQIFGVIPPLA